MRLEDLTQLEYEWLSRMVAVRGSIDERHQTYRESGIYDAWRDIFDRYVALASQDSLEALKRAVFLRWYECSEPSWLNGLFELNGDSSKRLVDLLERHLSQDSHDDELVWMLPYYYSLSDSYLGAITEGSEILKSSALENACLWRQRLDLDAMQQRGQLGEYWQSIRKDAHPHVPSDAR